LIASISRLRFSHGTTVLRLYDSIAVDTAHAYGVNRVVRLLRQHACARVQARTLIGEQTDHYSAQILCNTDDVHVAVVDNVRAHADVHQATACAQVQACAPSVTVCVRWLTSQQTRWRS